MSYLNDNLVWRPEGTETRYTSMNKYMSKDAIIRAFRERIKKDSWWVTSYNMFVNNNPDHQIVLQPNGSITYWSDDKIIIHIPKEDLDAFDNDNWELFD